MGTHVIILALRLSRKNTDYLKEEKSLIIVNPTSSMACLTMFFMDGRWRTDRRYLSRLVLGWCRVDYCCCCVVVSCEGTGKTLDSVNFSDSKYSTFVEKHAKLRSVLDLPPNGGVREWLHDKYRFSSWLFSSKRLLPRLL